TRTSTPALVTRASGSAIEGDAAEENAIAGELGEAQREADRRHGVSKADHHVAVVDREDAVPDRDKGHPVQHGEGAHGLTAASTVAKIPAGPDSLEVAGHLDRNHVLPGADQSLGRGTTHRGPAASGATTARPTAPGPSVSTAAAGRPRIIRRSNPNRITSVGGAGRNAQREPSHHQPAQPAIPPSVVASAFTPSLFSHGNPPRGTLRVPQ